MSVLHCGVDFGTTNSTVGLCSAGGAPYLIPVEGTDVTIPSALFFSLEDGSVHFGRSAVHEYMDGAEGRFMRALKSILGTSLMKETTQVGRDRMTFQGLIGRFLRNLRGQLEAQHGSVPDHVVFGRPVFFIDGNEAADRTAQDQLEAAAREEGFKHIEFQFEPVAAALNFERELNSEVLALIVDIGGGTSDFDRHLNIARVMPEFGLGSSTRDGKRQLPVWYFNDMATWHKINQLYTAKTMRDIHSLQREAAEPEKLDLYKHLLENRSGHRLAAQVEKAKIDLTDVEASAVRLKETGLDLTVPVSRGEFEQASDDLVRKIGIAIDEALASAGVTADAIETVVLTGGGAQVPLVRKASTARFPGAQIVQSDRFGAVGLGLALDAARRFG
jgi:hypothetical chaperone protein